METFYSIQGEGKHSGSPAYFIRLGGCDVGCFWCDVKESWDIEAHPKQPTDQIAGDAKESGTRIVVVTGGEPGMHNLADLTDKLRQKNLRTHLETAGVHKLTGDWDWICFSPKKFKKPLDSVYEVADELKVVIYNRHDLEWAQEHAARVKGDCELFMQPEWDQRDQVIPMILNFIRENPRWQISLQTHKYIGVP